MPVPTLREYFAPQDDTAAFAGGLLAFLHAVERGERTVTYPAGEATNAVGSAGRGSGAFPSGGERRS
jgi:hypothetical protein